MPPTPIDILQTIPSPVFKWPLEFCAFSTVTTYILSILTGNVSQVDRVWTFLPVIYSAYFALLPLWPRQAASTIPYVPIIPYIPENISQDLVNGFTPRALLMLGLCVIWMFRLSYNTFRRGLFSLTDEDYRWAVLRKQLHPIIFQIFNLTFVAATQNALLLLLGLPTCIAATRQAHTPLAPSDFILAIAALVVLATEFTADNQQYSFQSFKHSILPKTAPQEATSGEGRRVREGSGHGDIVEYNKDAQWPGARINWTLDDAKRGFVTRGLWAYSRHPNFACEQTFWWIITIFPLIAPYPPSLPSTGVFIRELMDKPSLAAFTPFAPLIPAFALSALFFSSTIFTESISQSKYPVAYAAYKERVGMFGFVRTWEKGRALGNRKAEVEKLVWGAPKKSE
ncbi:hypothetical protein HGRIS_003627 [Hohenbuehelia grisea]|uniref:DUF1295-domain-containing protein n=1 Tax=Hohenbuehelia grisea TaxID=104357 RepID=A0ABR3JG18_9AGAR